MGWYGEVLRLSVLRTWWGKILHGGYLNAEVAALSLAMTRWIWRKNLGGGYLHAEVAPDFVGTSCTIGC